jgi:hypothetical protein
MKNKEFKKYLQEEIEHMEYYNQMAPFPVYSTEHIQDLKDAMNNLKEEETNYDELPVIACKNCKSLHIVTDDDDNDICMRCHSINELVTFDNIYEYKKESNIWNEE